MRRALPTLLPWTLVLAGSTALFLMLQWPEGLGSGLMWKQPAGHFWVVSVASITCLGIALVATVAAIRTANARVVLLALSFLSMAGVFSVHGLTTPGFFLDAASSPAAVAPPVALVSTDSDYGGSSPGPNPEQVTPAPSGPPRYLMVTGFSGRLALALAALFLAASAIPWPGRVERALVRWRRGVLGGAVGLLALYAWLALTQPQLVPAWLVQREAFAWGTLALVTVCGLGAAVRFIIGYRRSGLTMYAAVSLGALMLVQAAFSVHFGSTWSGTFWLYHLQLLVGFTAVLWGVLVAYSEGRAVQSFEALTVTDVLQQLRSGYTESIVTLSAALEARDGYTLGHGERVAALAVLIGQEMRLPDHRLRALTAGALLHDVGKIGVPDAVLHKPSSLDADEYDVIKEHPARGAEMLRGAFGQRIEAQVIRHHHERWDGTGYPDGLAGEAIPLEARIAAVADVYDALRTDRAYRPAWGRDDARKALFAGRDSHFDPRCVDAFAQVVDQWEGRHGGSDAYAARRIYAA